MQATSTDLLFMTGIFTATMRQITSWHDPVSDMRMVKYQECVGSPSQNVRTWPHNIARRANPCAQKATKSHYQYLILFLCQYLIL